MNEKETRIPKQKRSIEKKQRIKDAAMKLMSEKGYYKTSSNEIAKEAGVSIGTFYSYFADKKALYAELVADIYDAVTLPLQTVDISEEVPIEQIVRSYVTLVFRGHEYESAFQREIASLSDQSDEFREIEMSCKGDISEMFINMLLPFKDELTVKDIETAAYVILTSVEAVVHDTMFHHHGENKQAIIDELTALICHYLFLS